MYQIPASQFINPDEIPSYQESHTDQYDRKSKEIQNSPEPAEEMQYETESSMGSILSQETGVSDQVRRLAQIFKNNAENYDNEAIKGRMRLHETTHYAWDSPKKAYVYDFMKETETIPPEIQKEFLLLSALEEAQSIFMEQNGSLVVDQQRAKPYYEFMTYRLGSLLVLNKEDTMQNTNYFDVIVDYISTDKSLEKYYIPSHDIAVLILLLNEPELINGEGVLVNSDDIKTKVMNKMEDIVNRKEDAIREMLSEEMWNGLSRASSTKLDKIYTTVSKYNSRGSVSSIV